MKNYTLYKAVLPGFIGMVLCASLQALTINPDTTPILAFGNQTSQSQINTAISSFIGSATELYKRDVGTALVPGGESGALAASYDTVFAATPFDPSQATITHVPGEPIVGDPAFLLVKDGNAEPAWYLFDLTALFWNGTETLELTNFWPGTGAISHVTLYGTERPDPGPGVPESGSTIAMLGLAFAAIGLLQRKFVW